MSKIILTTITPTYALKAKRILKAYGINAEVVKVTRTKSTGCTGGIQVDDKDLYDAISILNNANIKHNLYTGK